MDNKNSKLTFSDVYEQIGKDLPIILKLKQIDNKVVDKSLIKSVEKYLDLLSITFVLFDINCKELSTTEELILISNKLMSIYERFELKRSIQSIDNSFKELEICVNSLEEKYKNSIREVKSQTTFEMEMSDKIKWYSNKRHEYYQKAKNKELFLQNIGFTSDLKRESIQQIKEQNEELKSRLNTINARLNEYKDFMPIESDLKKRISDLKTEINDLEHIFVK